jgi:hypothetical protein
MGSGMRVPVVAKPGCDTNAIGLSLTYVKGKGVVLSATPMTVKDGMESFFLFSGLRVLVESMTRLNRKRLDTLESLTRNEIAMRLGRAWDIVQRVAAEAELTIPPSRTRSRSPRRWTNGRCSTS